jgi:hypothetical protein
MRFKQRRWPPAFAAGLKTPVDESADRLLAANQSPSIEMGIKTKFPFGAEIPIPSPNFNLFSRYAA